MRLAQAMKCVSRKQNNWGKAVVRCSWGKFKVSIKNLNYSIIQNKIK